ncbi:hypothetical protein SSX86_017249 [Deinandra increscens subsp. villosa]|uniref:Uncharacterized protein n=1 Tax=Deinandra increscens subsp. villosa TaxID=3103831 RepID=A0AAP0CUX1_9ASTR
MNNSGKPQQSVSDREVDEQQKSKDDSSPESSGSGEGSSTAISGDSLAMSNGNDIGIADRLTDLLVGDGDRDSDLLMQRNTQQEGTVMQWLLALDMQVMGACRADERLKPLLKLNASSGAEDRLLSHLSQHFEPSEVGLLARCLCIPLASVRVGKIKKQGTLLTPTSTRGNLVISLLPTSDLRISFLADDGCTDTLSILRNISDCSSVKIEGIPTDSSGRSFAVRIPNKDPFYFWCSEKSRLLGNELLEKMKNLLKRKPSLAELTGISDSRLERFVHHLRINFLRSNSASEAGQSSQSQNLLSKTSRSRSCNFQVVLSPRPSSFKLRRRTDGGRSETSEKHAASCPSTSNNGKRKLLDSSSGTCLFPSLPMPSSTAAPQISPPYYCWCPPVVSVTTLQTEPFTLPPLSSLFPSLPMPLSTSVPQISPPYYCWCPPVSVTTLQTEPFTLPPLSSLLPMPSPNLSEMPILPLSMSASSQVFTPLMCDPIVHLPVIDICSSGQAYLVNSGPAINVSIPPHHNQFVQETTESEKSARDTLRVLISGSGQMFTPLMCNPIVHLPVIDICSSGQAYLVNSGPAISVSIPPLRNSFVQETMESERSVRDTLQVLISRSGQFPSVVAKSDGGDTNVITGMGLVSARRCIDQGDLVETGGVGLGKDDPSEESSSRE